MDCDSSSVLTGVSKPSSGEVLEIGCTMKGVEGLVIMGEGECFIMCCWKVVTLEYLGEVDIGESGTMGLLLGKKE